MQEHRSDGSTRLTEKATAEDVRQARRFQNGREFALLAPGSKVERWTDGRRYTMVVQADGSLLPAHPDPEE